MTAPEALPGEVWRSANGLEAVVLRGDRHVGMWWDADDCDGIGSWCVAQVTGGEILAGWALAMMAERDAALADARLRGLPPSLPGYGHDEEPAEDEAARLQRWYERTGKTIVAKPREP